MNASGRAVTLGLLEPFGYGRGYPDWLTVTQPAAGANATVTVEGQNLVRVLAARAALTTDANAANRLLCLDFVDARGVTRLRNGAGLVVTANTTAQAFEWNCYRTVSEWAANTPVFAPVAPLFLSPGFTVKFTVDAIQATDQLSGLSLWVEKFETGSRGYPTGAVLERDWRYAEALTNREASNR